MPYQCCYTHQKIKAAKRANRKIYLHSLPSWQDCLLLSQAVQHREFKFTFKWHKLTAWTKKTAVEIMRVLFSLCPTNMKAKLFQKLLFYHTFLLAVEFMFLASNNLSKVSGETIQWRSESSSAADLQMLTEKTVEASNVPHNLKIWSGAQIALSALLQQDRLNLQINRLWTK